MFTTEGINLSAKSAKELGTFCEFDLDEKIKTRENIKKRILKFFILVFHIINNNKSNNSEN